MMQIGSDDDSDIASGIHARDVENKELTKAKSRGRPRMSNMSLVVFIDQLARNAGHFEFLKLEDFEAYIADIRSATNHVTSSATSVSSSTSSRRDIKYGGSLRLI